VYGYVYGENQADRPFLQVLAQLADIGNVERFMPIGSQFSNARTAFVAYGQKQDKK